MKKFGQWLIRSFSYPVMIMFIALVVVLYLMVKVAPTFQSVFDGFGAKLPAPTMLIVSISKYLQWLNRPWAVFLVVPLYLGLTVIYEKYIVKVKWATELTEWMLIVFF